MQINATIIVQIFNFLITYVLIDHIFLKSAFEALENDEQASTKLMEMVVSRRATVDEIERHQKERWDACKQEMAIATPKVSAYQESIARIKGIDISLIQISSDQERKLIKQSSQYIVKKMQETT